MTNILINENSTIKNTLKKLDETATKVLLVVDENDKFLGTITDGDIRRFILKGKGLKNIIKDVYNKNSFYIEKDCELGKLKKKFLEKQIELIPLVNLNKKIIKYYTWHDVFNNKKLKSKINQKIPVVIMAGGKGTRLDPFTKIFPKALIPVGEKPILEIIIDEFRKYGLNSFYFTLNYKGDMIESYFNSLKKNYDVNSIWEKEFLGTAGSLNLLDKSIVKTDFILSNCDIIVKADYSDILKFHQENNATLTIVSAVKHYKIPYGIIKFKKKGEVVNITEKPEYTFVINTGVYIINKKVLEYIPENKKFDMNELIDILIKNKEKIQCYPVNEQDYTDIGQWSEYKKAKQKIDLLGNE